MAKHGRCLVTGSLFLLALLCGAGCRGREAVPPVEPPAAFSFEAGLEGWSPAATDVQDGEAVATWYVEHSTERASDGVGSVHLRVDNMTDAAKVWVEQRFELEPNTSYRVELDFDLSTADWGDFNLWRVIAGALPARPLDRDDLEPAYREETGTGTDEDDGHVWLPKQYSFEVTTGPDGEAWVVIGVWGTYEVFRGLPGLLH